MARVGGVSDVDRYRPEDPRVRRDGAEHPEHPAATTIAHHRRRRATLSVALHDLWHGMTSLMVASEHTPAAGTPASSRTTECATRYYDTIALASQSDTRPKCARAQ
jgi:hypothetical protein